MAQRHLLAGWAPGLLGLDQLRSLRGRWDALFFAHGQIPTAFLPHASKRASWQCCVTTADDASCHTLHPLGVIGLGQQLLSLTQVQSEKTLPEFLQVAQHLQYWVHVACVPQVAQTSDTWSESPAGYGVRGVVSPQFSGSAVLRSLSGQG